MRTLFNPCFWPINGQYMVNTVSSVSSICPPLSFGNMIFPMMNESMSQALRGQIQRKLPSLVNTALDWKRLETVAKRVDPASLEARSS